jgi:hypothetical protein
MELRNVQAIVLSQHTDELMNVSYLKILTLEHIESVKLPTAVKNYRLQHLLRPNYLLELELIRTKKNWIVKGILDHEEFCPLDNYTEYLKFAEIVALINKYSHDGQEVKILDLLVNTFRRANIQNLDLVSFESRLLQRLGFAPHLEAEANLPLRLHWAKSSSGLV